jgi:hypothetical protein
MGTRPVGWLVVVVAVLRGAVRAFSRNRQQRSERRFYADQVQDRDVSGLGRGETHRRQTLFELRALPSSSDVFLRLPNTHDVQGIGASCTVVPQLAEPHSAASGHDHLVDTIVCSGQFSDVTGESRNQQYRHAITSDSQRASPGLGR